MGESKLSSKNLIVIRMFVYTKTSIEDWKEDQVGEKLMGLEHKKRTLPRWLLGWVEKLEDQTQIGL